MSKRRKPKQEELMLIPFLDILCSLIGVLVLIIVALCVAQTQRAKGITAEQFELSKKFQQLTVELKKLKVLVADREKTEALLQKLKALTDEKQKMEQAIANAAQTAAKKKEEQDRLAGTIAELKAQIEQEKTAEIPIGQELSKLREAVAAKQAAAQVVTEPSLVIQRSGPGAGFGRYIFAEASAKGLTIHLDGGQKKEIPGPDPTASPDYKSFLAGIKGSTYPTTLVFLIRKDGTEVYKKAAVMSETDYAINTAALPLPAGGNVDVGAFAPNQALPRR
jgi:multidrug efflux pump subunit AcrA (membrane-fusion protein)